MRPPLTTSMTVPVTMPSSSLIFSMVPRARSYWARFFERIRRPSLSSFWKDQGLDLVADGDDLVRVDVVLDRELSARDDTFGLVPDVEQDLVPVDLHDDAVDDVAVVEVLDRLVDRGEESFLVTDVVDRYRRGGGGGLGAARHVGKGSGPDIEVVGTATPEPVSLCRSRTAKEAPEEARWRLDDPRGHTTDASAACYVSGAQARSATCSIRGRPDMVNARSRPTRGGSPHNRHNCRLPRPCRGEQDPLGDTPGDPAGRKSTRRGSRSSKSPKSPQPEATRREAGVTVESLRPNRGWWDRNADEYQNEHGTFLGDDRFVWGPEGLDEVEAELLGPRRRS
ncbi:hypothetical protein SALBM217S_01639 [Streptomyces griseoloalbus]